MASQPDREPREEVERATDRSVWLQSRSSSPSPTEGSCSDAPLSHETQLGSTKMQEAADNYTITCSAAPAPPLNPKVKKAAETLAKLVAKYGNILEVVTCQNKLALTQFLLDDSCTEYMYYKYRLEEEKALLEGRVKQLEQEKDSSRQVGVE